MTSAARLAVNALTASEQLGSSSGLSVADSVSSSSGTGTSSSGGSSGKSFKCQFCAKEFPKSCNLTTHLRTHTGEKPYLCGVCQRGFSQSGSLHVHQRTHTGEKPYKCHLCDKRFVQVGSLSVHLKIHTGEQPHQCHLCQQRFAQSSSLRRHIKIHNGEKNYKCKFCAKDFVQSSQLVKHTRTHTGEKPYACKYCDKRFSQSNSLEIHQRVHTGERPYKCDFCDKRFPQSSLLTRHIQVHTRENFCKCDFCDKPFPLQSLLDEHMQLHRDNPFECEYCNKCFSKAARLMEHLKEHAGEEPYRCRFCDKTFSRHRNLCQHLKFHTRQRALVFPQVEKFWEELQDPNGVKTTASHAAVCDVLTQSCFKDDNDLFKTIAAGALREKIHPGDTDTTGMELAADLATCCKNEQHVDACDAAATSAAVAAAAAANRRNGYPPRLEVDVGHKKVVGLSAEIHCCDDQDNPSVCDNATDENQAAAAAIDQGYKPLQVDLQMSEQAIGHGEKTCKMLCTTDTDPTPTVVHTYISSCPEQGHITAELPPGAKAVDPTAVVTAGGPYQCGETIITANAVFDGSGLPKTSGACLVSLRTCEPSVFTSATVAATAPPPTVHLERAMSAELAVVDQLVSHSQTPVRQKDGTTMDIGKPNLFECDMDIKLYLPDRGEAAGSALSVTTAHPVQLQQHPHHVAPHIPQPTGVLIAHPALPSQPSVHIPATMRDTKRKSNDLCTFTCKGNMYTKPNVNTLPSDCVEKGRSPGSYDCDLPHGYG